MLALLLQRREFRHYTEIADCFGQNENTVSSTLSKFRNELNLLDYDNGGYYRLTPGRELEAWGYVLYGRDAFKTTLRESAKEALLNRPEVTAYLESIDPSGMSKEDQQRLKEFR
ncbi:hypothetical protein [Halorussus sp. AFM4]|uniref:hypothetical protein n=1 Tax=Halorussus sp. AFM4 TaxID=3421651 RepID=UPI003EBCA55E